MWAASLQPAILLLVGIGAVAPSAQGAPLIVETEARSPQEQQSLFRLPPGFKIQLVACEPTIGQPMNLSFDAAGRLWVTSSVEYPYPAAGEGVEPRDERFPGQGEHPPRDHVTILSDFDSDGRARSSHTIIDGLNIPIGVTALTSRHGLVFSIPNVYHVLDSDGDGKADVSPAVYGPFGNVDTHGMVNSLTPWIDGWVYACHGFRNTSSVDDAHGHELTMNSGNTFRFREDGSQIEQFTWGQVNPFGMTFDAYGHLFNADCHSMPVTNLLRGAYYPSFGKPHDGMGFGPNMIDHSHGSTGICGVAYYEGNHFPQLFRDCLYICNPVNGQVHRDRLTRQGSTLLCDTQPEFITCDDGWFRPVDVKLGPDGALYIADFYNAIIGHYEVPLDHPSRDRTHGRIWRVVYEGRAGETVRPLRHLPDIEGAPTTEVIESLGDDNLTTRVLATHEMVRRADARVLRRLQSIVRESKNARQRAHALWVIERTVALEDRVLVAAGSDVSPLVRTHVQKILAERSTLSPTLVELVQRACDDGDGFVRRAAADAAGQHPAPSLLPVLLEQLRACPLEDSHLRHMLRLAIRNHLRHLDEPAMRRAVDALASDYGKSLLDVFAGVHTASAARYVLDMATAFNLKLESTHVVDIATYGDRATRELLYEQRRQATAASPEAGIEELKQIRSALRQRGVAVAELSEWADTVATALLEQVTPEEIVWVYEPLDPADRRSNPFQTQRRMLAGKEGDRLFVCTHPSGEQRTGKLWSTPFPLPAELSFWMAGHNGPLDQPATQNNVVRLRLASSGKVLQEAYPPRHDIARRFEWDIPEELVGAEAWIEVVDGDDRNAYAWLAVGQFSQEGIDPTTQPPLDLALDLVAAVLAPMAETRLKEIARSSLYPSTVRVLASEAIRPRQDADLLAAMRPFVLSPSRSSLHEPFLRLVTGEAEVTATELLVKVAKTLPQSGQERLAHALAASRGGAMGLLMLLGEGHLSRQVLNDPKLVLALEAHAIGGAKDRLDAWRAELPTESTAVLERLARLASAALGNGSAIRGADVFKQHCAACHQRQGIGAKIGPQLDGIGQRGRGRLLEDILLPNRNVDAAFRTTIIVTDAGKVITGLLRREVGETVVIANSEGKEIEIGRKQIEAKRVVPLSPMPANLHERLSDEHLEDLLAFLLASP